MARQRKERRGERGGESQSILIPNGIVSLQGGISPPPLLPIAPNARRGLEEGATNFARYTHKGEGGGRSALGH